jgi:uncharacterized protein
MDEIIARPQPDVRGVGRKYWASGRNGKLEIPQCCSCDKVHWYPRLYCPHCGSDQLQWISCSGKGSIHTFTIVRQSAHKYFKSKVPYVLAMVSLAEGPLIMSNIIDCKVEEVAIGFPVVMTFEDFGEFFSVPLFRLDREGA